MIRQYMNGAGRDFRSATCN